MTEELTIEEKIEALKVLEVLAKKDPFSHTLDWATSLKDIASYFYENDDLNSAEKYYKKGSEILTRICQQNPDEFQPTLAIIKYELAKIYRDNNQNSEALEASKKSVQLFKSLSTRHPGKFDSDLAGSLNNLGLRQNISGDSKTAQESAQKAVEIYKKLRSANPKEYTSIFAISLGTLGTLCKNDGELRKARNAFRNGLEAITTVFLEAPRPNAKTVILLLRDYAGVCEELGNTPDMEMLEPILEKLNQIKAEKEENTS
jgi:tetratricopeptide (TPR) repeat protein